MLLEFLKALLFAGLPVGVVSYLLIWWALRAKYLERTGDLKQVELHFKQLSKARSSRKKNAKKAGEEDAPTHKLNPVHNKWLAFGGGFYGVVALITLVVIETTEILGFFADFRENVSRLADFGFDLVVSFFVDQMMNFVTALAWPGYWMSEVGASAIWIWFLAAYGGYWLGARAALAGYTLPGLDR
jgi:hypothetical protein